MQEEMQKRKKYSIIMGIVFAVALVLTILSRIMADGKAFSYETVEVTVKKVEASAVNTKGKKLRDIDVVVSYEGKEYDLKNVLTGEISKYEAARAYSQPVEVLFCNGKMYSNVQGIKSGAAIAKLYFVFLAMDFVAFLLMVMNIGKYNDCKKKS